MNKEIPIGVKIISILYYIGAVLGIIFGILAMTGGGILNSLAQVPGFNVSGTGLFVTIGLILIAFGILSFFVGRGLWKGQNWARMAAIILAIPGILFALMTFTFSSIISSVINLGINCIIPAYLLFNKKVKAVFSYQ